MSDRILYIFILENALQFQPISTLCLIQLSILLVLTLYYSLEAIFWRQIIAKISNLRLWVLKTRPNWHLFFVTPLYSLETTFLEYRTLVSFWAYASVKQQCLTAVHVFKIKVIFVEIARNLDLLSQISLNTHSSFNIL